MTSLQSGEWGMKVKNQTKEKIAHSPFFSEGARHSPFPIPHSPSFLEGGSHSLVECNRVRGVHMKNFSLKDERENPK